VGLFAVYLKTSIYEGMKIIQSIIFNTEINDSVLNKSYNIRKMANNGKHPRFTSTAAILKHDGEKTEHTQSETFTKKHGLSLESPIRLQQLIEINKNIYTYDVKEKQLSDKFLLRLNGSFEDRRIKGQRFDSCSGLISDIKLRHDIKYFVFQYSYEPSPIDVTLLSHLTLNRGIHRIAKILGQWP
ncbi:unnamed protein product, partial [Owenia fusiformis]